MLGKVSIAIEAQIAQFQADMGRAARISEKEFKKIQRDGEEALRELKSEAKAAGAAMGAIIAGGAVATGVAIRNMLQEANQIRRLSELSGIGEQAFQKLAAGARTAGIENDKLADIFKDTQDKVGDYLQNEGGALKDFFDNIAGKVGVTAKEFAKLSGPEALQLYVNTLQRAGLSQSEMIFYMEAIASDASLLLPLLKDGGAGFKTWGEEAEQAGAIMSGATLDATRELSKEMDRLKLGVDGMWKEALPGLIPQLQDLSRTLNSEEFREGFKTLIGGAMTAVGWLAKLATTTSNVTGFLAEAAAARVHGPGLHDPTRIEDAIGRQRRLLAELDQVSMENGRVPEGYDPLTGRGGRRINTSEYAARQREELKRLMGDLTTSRALMDDQARRARELAAEAAKPPVQSSVTVDLSGVGLGRGASASKGKSDADRERDALARAIEQYNAQLDRQIGLYGAVGEAGRLAYETTQGSLKAASEEAKSFLAEKAEWADWLDEMRVIDEAITDATQEQVASMDRHRESARGLLDDLQFELELTRMTNQEKQVAVAIRHAHAQGIYSEDEAIRDYLQRIQEAQEMAEVFDEVRGSAVDMFASFLDGSQSAGDAFEDFANRLRRLAAQLLAEKALQALFNAFGNAMWGDGQGANGTFSFFSGGGYTGPGGVYEPAGIVHKGEVVWSQRDVARAGGVGVVEAMRLRGYSGGGVVGGSVAPMPSVGKLVEINNYGSPERIRQTETTERMPNGEVLQKLVIDILRDDIGSGGGTDALLRSRYGLRPVI